MIDLMYNEQHSPEYDPATRMVTVGPASAATSFRVSHAAWITIGRGGGTQGPYRTVRVLHCQATDEQFENIPPQWQRDFRGWAANEKNENGGPMHTFGGYVKFRGNGNRRYIRRPKDSDDVLIDHDAPHGGQPVIPGLPPGQQRR